MANPAGESNVLKLDFDRRLILQFCGFVVTSDAACSEFHDALGLTEMAIEKIRRCTYRQERLPSRRGLPPVPKTRG